MAIVCWGKGILPEYICKGNAGHHQAKFNLRYTGVSGELGELSHTLSQTVIHSEKSRQVPHVSPQYSGTHLMASLLYDTCLINLANGDRYKFIVIVARILLVLPCVMG